MFPSIDSYIRKTHCVLKFLNHVAWIRYILVLPVSLANLVESQYGSLHNDHFLFNSNFVRRLQARMCWNINFNNLTEGLYYIPKQLTVTSFYSFIFGFQILFHCTYLLWLKRHVVRCKEDFSYLTCEPWWPQRNQSFPNIINVQKWFMVSGVKKDHAQTILDAILSALLIFPFLNFSMNTQQNKQTWKTGPTTFSLYWQLIQELVLAVKKKKSNCWSVAGPPDLCDQWRVIPHFVMFN